MDGKFRKKKSFTMVCNTLLHDNSISMRAKGLYAIIQSYITIPNFVLYKSFLISNATEGTTAFNSAWNELKEKGYLKQYKMRTENGFTYEYDLLDEPDLSTPSTIIVRIDGSISEQKTESQEETEISALSSGDEILEETLKTVEEQIEYEVLKENGNQYADSCLWLITQIYLTREKHIKIGGHELLTAEVKKQFEKLTSEDIDEIAYNIQKHTKKQPTNPKSYLLAALYHQSLNLDIGSSIFADTYTKRE